MKQLLNPRGRRRWKYLVSAVYILTVILIAHTLGWKLLLNYIISTKNINYYENDYDSMSTSYLLNYTQIVGDDDDSLSLDYKNSNGKINLLPTQTIMADNTVVFDTNYDNKNNIVENSSHYYDIRNKTKIIAVDSNEFSYENLNGCPDWNCRIVNNAEEFENANAIVVKDGFVDKSKRRPDQYVVFFSQESPLNWAIPAHLPSTYNLTMGYRRDADAPCPYGYFVKKHRVSPLNESYLANLEKIVRGKTKFAAWFVSNCYAASGRTELVAELQKYVRVDIFGACGTMSCPKSVEDSNGADRCSSMLDKDYKFYFAFENSICKDYTTEKFWQKIALNVVVVVLSRRIVEKYAPKKSFIAADDFESPLALANYLLLLDRNPQLYMEYFKWRAKYESIFLNGLVHDVRERPWGFCRLCKILWRRPPLRKVYAGLLSDGYWHANQCYGNIFELMKLNIKTTKLLAQQKTQLLFRSRTSNSNSHINY